MIQKDSDAVPQRHNFNDAYNFSWSEITAEKDEKAVLASFYMRVAAVEVMPIFQHRSEIAEVEPIALQNTYLCGASIAFSHAIIGSSYEDCLIRRGTRSSKVGQSPCSVHVLIFKKEEKRQWETIKLIMDNRLCW